MKAMSVWLDLLAKLMVGFAIALLDDGDYGLPGLLSSPSVPFPEQVEVSLILILRT